MRDRLYLSHTEPDTAIADTVEAFASERDLRFSGRTVPHQGQFPFGDHAQQLRAASVVLVLLTVSTPEDQSVAREVDASLDLAKGLVILRMGENLKVPRHLWDTGAEVLDWGSPVDIDYLPKAIESARRGAALLEKAAHQGSGSGAACARPHRH